MKRATLLRTFLAFATGTFFSISAWAASSSTFHTCLSSILTLPTSSADHFKTGLALSTRIHDDSRWSPWISIESAWLTLVTVNPGAQPNAAQPDFGETRTGSAPFQLRLWLGTPLRFGEFRIAGGMTWLYYDIRNAASAYVPNAPTVALNWRKKLHPLLHLESLLGLAMNPFQGGAYLVLPESTLQLDLGKSLGANAGIRLPLTQFGGGLTFTGINPSFTLGLEFKI